LHFVVNGYLESTVDHQSQAPLAPAPMSDGHFNFPLKSEADVGGFDLRGGSKDTIPSTVRK
jgi:hypothetical protein